MEKIIEVKNLQKHYEKVHAVKGLDFYVEKGKLFAFLGPNGAGKSTTINILCTLLSYEEGSVVIDGLTLGKDDSDIRKSIGIVFQDSLLDPFLTVEENLMTRASFYHNTHALCKEYVDNALKSVNITDLKDRRYGNLSGGQRRRADIARALVNNPKILFLDEPTTGLDPQTRKNVWETIEALQKNTQLTVFLTTHYMEEAAMAEYVVVIDEGIISAKGTPTELKDRYSSDTLQVKPKDKDALMSELSTLKIGYELYQDIIRIDLENTLSSLPIIRKIEPHIESFQVVNGSMDDAFIRITGKEMR